MKTLDDLLAKLGGTADTVGGLLSKLGASTVTYTGAPEAKASSDVVNIRGVPVSKGEFDTYFRPTLFGEVSNRPTEKKRLERDVIFNTAINRMVAHQGRGTSKTLKDILTEPNQYQAYGGEQYKLYGSATSSLDLKKKKEIDTLSDELWGQLSKGQVKDTTNGAFYYSHGKDQTISYDDKRPLFAK